MIRIFYASASTIALSTVYYINKDTFFTGDKSPIYAFSLWPSNKSDDFDLSDALQGTVSDEKQIADNKDRMRYKMEAFITNLQGKVIKQLQELEPESKFVVDKWSRKEVFIL